MGESNAEWGALASFDEKLAAVWDGYERLPEPGAVPALDSLCERKHIAIRDLVRLGARLSEPDVLAFAFPGGIKFRHLVSDKRWSYKGSTWPALKIVQHALTRAPDAIVAEGESDAARLTSVYEADVAVMPAGAGYFPPAYADQLRPYERVLVALDNDDAGNEGAERILAALVQATRFAPPPNTDWCALTTMPDLPERATRLVVGGLKFEDLARVSPGEPETLVDDLLYAEGVHWFSGHPGSGKTTLLMHVAHQVMSQGLHVVWLDYEGGSRPTLRRLLACGVPVELFEHRFHYASWVPDAPQYFPAIAEQWPGALIVLDSASKSIQMAGLDENSASEVTKWVGPIVKAAKLHGLPIAVIDHVPKTATSKYAYSRGAGSKMADADVAWYVEKVADFNREQSGTICAHQQKDREGVFPFRRWFKVGNGAGALTLDITEEPPDHEESI